MRREHLPMIGPKPAAAESGWMKRVAVGGIGKQGLGASRLFLSVVASHWSGR
jgi:hypothetical protein